jgi:hypothetical protein
VSLERGAETRAVEVISMGAPEAVRDQRLGSLGVRDASVEFSDFVLREAIPGPASPGPSSEKPTDLGDGESCVLVEANQRYAFSGPGRVLPAPASTLGG